MEPDATRLSATAREAVKRGDLAGAEEIYRQILDRAPEHLGALTFCSMMAKERGRIDESRSLLQRALQVDPENAVLWRNLGIIELESRQPDAARASFEKALDLNPEDAVTHLYLAESRHHAGETESAAKHYFRALSLDPTLARQNPSAEISRLVNNAKRARAKLHREYHQAVVDELAENHSQAELGRIREFVKMHHDPEALQFADPLQQPAFQFFPGLEPKPWFEETDFPWLAEVCAQSEVIREELLSIIDDESQLSPYVAHQGKVPGDWRKLSNSLDWSAYHIYKEGEKVAAHCEQCPQTAAVLERSPLVVMPGQAPEAFFSILRPHTHIPPHFGLANHKLAVHLPLVLPEDCAIRVGSETRGWEMGHCLVFDDSFEHEAWNRSADSRAVLIFEIWNPQLTEVEREAMARLTAATVRFHEFCQRHLAA